MTLPPCRPYQTKAIDDARAAINRGAQGVLIVQPTGCGKTRTAVEACHNHRRLDGIPMFVAPRRELVQQASATLYARGLEPGHDAFVRTIQELSMPNAKIPHGVTMVVLDEARHYLADAWSRLRVRLPNAIYVGLDATPERGDGLGLGSMFDELVEAITIGDAIAQGYLVPVDFKRPDRLLGPRELAQEPVDAYFMFTPGESAVLFAQSVELAQKYAAEFDARGIPAAAVWGDMPTSDRDEALARYEAGDLKVLCNVQILTEGWDSPRTSSVILASSVGTAGGLLQRAGRGLRPFPGKKRCMLLDLPGVTHLHGDVDEPRTWHLEGRAARRTNEMMNVRFCPVCGAAAAVGMSCETCGFEGDMKKRKPRVLGLPMDRFARQYAMPDEEAAKFLRGYLRAAEAKGFRKEWAFRAFSAKYGRPVTLNLRRLAASAAR